MKLIQNFPTQTTQTLLTKTPYQNLSEDFLPPFFKTFPTLFASKTPQIRLHAKKCIFQILNSRPFAFESVNQWVGQLGEVFKNDMVGFIGKLCCVVLCCVGNLLCCVVLCWECVVLCCVVLCCVVLCCIGSAVEFYGSALKVDVCSALLEAFKSPDESSRAEALTCLHQCIKSNR